MFDAARLVADAKLALARDDAERESTVEQIVSVTQEVERQLEAAVKANVGSEMNYLRARLAREAAEIELLKLRQSRASSTTRPG